MRRGRETRERERGRRSIAFQNDRERNSAPAAPRPLGRCAREVPVFVQARSLPRRARRGGVWGRYRVSKRLSNSAFPRAEGRVRYLSPKAGELGVAPRRGALGLASPFTTRKKRDFHFPRPMGLARVVPKEAFDWRCPIGRGSPFKVVVKPLFLCFAPLADFARGRGRRGRFTPPKTERGNSESNTFALNLPRSVFRLRRASPPYPLRGTTQRTTNRRTGVQFRLARPPPIGSGYSRAK